MCVGGFGGAGRRYGAPAQTVLARRRARLFRLLLASGDVGALRNSPAASYGARPTGWLSRASEFSLREVRSRRAFSD
jgi:hypothetical protein